MKIKFPASEHIPPGMYRLRKEFLFLPKIVGSEIRWLVNTAWIECYSAGLWYDWRATTWVDTSYKNEEDATLAIDKSNARKHGKLPENWLELPKDYINMLLKESQKPSFPKDW